MLPTVRFASAALVAALVVIFTSCAAPRPSGLGGNGAGGTYGAGVDTGCSDMPCADHGGVCDPTTNMCVACLPPGFPCPGGSYCDPTHACRPGCGSDDDCTHQICVAHVCTGECRPGETQCSGSVV